MCAKITAWGGGKGRQTDTERCVALDICLPECSPMSQEGYGVFRLVLL